MCLFFVFFFFFSSRRRHTRYWRDWSSDVCSSDLRVLVAGGANRARERAPSRDTERRWHRSAQATGALAPASSVRERWRSEERRGGKEGRSRGAPDHLKKKKKKKVV